MKTKKHRDFILISSITVILLAVFLFFQFVIFKQESAKAEVYYRGEVVYEVDFINKKTTLIKRQHDVNDQVPVMYPFEQFDKETNTGTITLLGDYGHNNEVVIKYDYNNNSMQVISETSPKKVCSNVGSSTFRPIECMPNNISILFGKTTNDDLDNIL